MHWQQVKRSCSGVLSPQCDKIEVVDGMCYFVAVPVCYVKVAGVLRIRWRVVPLPVVL